VGTQRRPDPAAVGSQHGDPDFNLGYVDAEEDDKGLKVHGYFDMESPKAAQTYRLLKSGRVNQMSSPTASSTAPT
jgi:HK97 family phage prohead protease